MRTRLAELEAALEDGRPAVADVVEIEAVDGGREGLEPVAEDDEEAEVGDRSHLARRTAGAGR